MATVHLGELLVKHGLITADQRDQILRAQLARGGPFGALAEQMFGVSPEAVERAWAEQYSTLVPHIDPRSYNVNPRALELITRRQAWQFCLLPIDFQADGHALLACTTQEHLPRALKFAGWRLAFTVEFAICEPLQLGEALEHHYPMAGMRADTVLRGLPAAG